VRRAKIKSTKAGRGRGRSPPVQRWHTSLSSTVTPDVVQAWHEFQPNSPTVTVVTAQRWHSSGSTVTLPLLNFKEIKAPEQIFTEANPLLNLLF